MTKSLEDLVFEWSALKATWNETRTAWNDPVAWRFEKEFWEPMQQAVENVVRAAELSAEKVEALNRQI